MAWCIDAGDTFMIRLGKLLECCEYGEYLYVLCHVLDQVKDTSSKPQTNMAC